MRAEKPITVAAAILERDGRVLACRRREDQEHAGKWEFPGGKVEAGESPAEALRRELAEELGVEAAVGDEIARYRYRYPGGEPIELIFFRVVEFFGEPDYAQFAEAKWLPAAELPALDFLAGDVEFVERLAERGGTT